MTKIDIAKWKEFQIEELFDIHPTKHYNDESGKALSNSKLFDDNGLNPVIVNSSYNNGIGGYSNKDCNEKGGIITFSDTTTSDAIFYQKKDFIGYSHVQGMYPKIYKDKWTDNSMRFFLVIFKSRANSLGYNYVNKFTRELANKMSVALPVLSDGTPDWNYMECYIQDMDNIANKKLNTYKTLIEIPFQKIDITKWKKFHLYDENLFYIDTGTKLDRVKMTEKKSNNKFCWSCKC